MQGLKLIHVNKMGPNSVCFKPMSNIFSIPLYTNEVVITGKNRMKYYMDSYKKYKEITHA